MRSYQQVELLSLLCAMGAAGPAAPEDAAPLSPKPHARPGVPATPSAPGERRLLHLWLAAFETYESTLFSLYDAPGEEPAAFATMEVIDRFPDLPRDLLTVALLAFERGRGSA